MSTFIFILILMIILVIALMFISNKPRELGELLVYPYASKKPLTDTEIKFYNKLKEALPNYILLPQVQLAGFIKIDRSLLKPNDTYPWKNTLLQQSIDYLICNHDFSIVAAVELDDKSHYSQGAIERDAKKTAKLEAAKIPLIRWHAERMPTQDEIQFEVTRYQVDKPTNSSNATEWFNEPNEQFLKPQNLINKNLFLIKLLLLFIGALIVLIGVNHFSKNIPKLIKQPSSITQSISDGIKQRNQDNLNARIEMQEFQKKEAIQKRRSELELQQEMNKRQDEVLAEAKREEIIKEELWNRNYKDKLNCSDNDYAVDCGNAYIQARKKFEAYWQANKSKHLN